MVEEVEQDLSGIVYLNKGENDDYSYQIGKGGNNGVSDASEGGTSYFKYLSETKIELSGGQKGTQKTLIDIIAGNNPDLGGKIITNKYNSSFGLNGKTSPIKIFDGVKGAFTGAESVFSGMTETRNTAGVVSSGVSAKYNTAGTGGDSEDVDIIGDGRDDEKGTGGFIRITYVGSEPEEVDSFQSNPIYIYP